MSGPSVTIIIAARPGQEEIPAVQAARGLEYPDGEVEIIVARGRQPAVQRNAALKAARGEIIYFLDDDSKPLPSNLRRGAAHFQDPQVVIVGGPNLCPPEAPLREKVFGMVLGSWLGFGPSRARYEAVGRVRETSEKELILCNMLARRDSLRSATMGGFDESLYPNEENALMDELQKDGGKLLYDPEMIVYRRPRPTLKAFCKMLLSYGRGRAEQVRLHPTPGSALNFVPPLFCLYLVALACRPLWFGWLGLMPLGLYALALCVQFLVFAARKPLLHSVAAIPLVVVTHVLYGIGFWRGLFTRLGASAHRAGATAAEVTLERH